MTKNKFVRLCLVSSIMALSFSSLAQAGEWKENNGNWQYVNTDGTPIQNKWVKSGDKWFYLGDDGNLVKDALIQDGGELYYADSEGAMLTEAWREVQDPDGVNESFWYYFTKTGKAYKGKGEKLSTKEIEGKKYLFDDTGKMVRGYVNADGQKIDADSTSPYVDTVYFFGDDGAMYTGKWHRYEMVADDNLFSKLAGREYQYYSEMWMYFDDTGKKVKASSDTSAKVKEVNGKRYAFDENGIMMPQFSVDNAEQFLSTSSNARNKVKLRYGSEDSDGHLTGDYWTFRVPSVDMDQKEFEEQEYSWFRTKFNGTLYKNKIQDVYGKKYAFDEIGRMQTGFVIMNEDGTFSKQFDIDAFNSEDFKTSAGIPEVLPVITRGNLYLFSSDELNDGSMISGKEISVALNDGVAVFGFKKNGIAYGNKNKLQKVGGKYYINGLRLNADAELGYGIIYKSANDAVVVDKNGSEVKGNRKVVRDGEGYWIVIQNNRFVARVNDADRPRWRDGKFWHYDDDKEKPQNQRYIAAISFSQDGDSNLDDDFIVYKN